MKHIVTTVNERAGVYPVGTSSCFNIGISGNCKNNCYKCSAFDNDEMTDQDIVDNFGVEEQERMLKEFEECGDL